MSPPPELLEPPGGWRPADGLRLDRATARRAPLPRLVTAAAALATRGRTRHVFRIVGLNRRVFRPFLAFNARLMPFGTLERRDTELAILRVAWLTRSRYEWLQHLRIGRGQGLTEAELIAVALGPDGPPFGARERALLSAVEQLVGERYLEDDAFAALEASLSDAQILELCLLAGNYAMLAGTLNSFRAPLESDPGVPPRG